ncbi:MAG: hypothetical protein D6679_02725 [Candidatus Hydrogenedentota bacterium]|nr:MAG: hypothetical protein D6679_02725 [Candidatus Hydrogenedentota bacterium]
MNECLRFEKRLWIRVFAAALFLLMSLSEIPGAARAAQEATEYPPPSSSEDWRVLPSPRVTLLEAFPRFLVIGTENGAVIMTSEGFSEFLAYQHTVVDVDVIGDTIYLGTLNGVAIVPDRGSGTERFFGLPKKQRNRLITGLIATPGSESELLLVGDFGTVRFDSKKGWAFGEKRLLTPIIAATGPAPDILLVTEHSILLYRLLRNDTLKIASDEEYLQVRRFRDNEWAALRSDGFVYAGRLDVPGVIPLPRPPGGNIVTTITTDPRNHPGTIWAGTFRGGILESHPKIDEPDAPAHSPLLPVTDVTVSGLPLTALAFFNGRLYAGSESGGVTIFEKSGTYYQPIGRLLARSAPLPKNKVIPSPKKLFSRHSLKNVLASRETLFRNVGSLLRTLPRSFIWTGGAGLAILLLLFILLRGLHRKSSGGPVLIEKRRQSRRPPDLPSRDQLSPELGAWARRLEEITEQINDLSRRKALGEAPTEILASLDRLKQNFDEIDSKMRARWEECRKQKNEIRSEIDALKHQVASGKGMNTKEAREVLRRLEERMRLLETDERYLRYVFEE